MAQPSDTGNGDDLSISRGSIARFKRSVLPKPEM